MNGMVLNPGYTGSRGTFALSSSYRKQWVGIKGAPEIETFSVHAPLKSDKVALGLMAFNESIGVKKTTGVFANYAYHIHAGSGRLSFGFAIMVMLPSKFLFTHSRASRKSSFSRS